VKAGDDVVVSGQFGFFSQDRGEVILGDCWPIPK
jgi:hypothetical protein